jgi:hypothetical protein
MRIEKTDKMVAMLAASAIGTADAESIQKVNEFAAELMSNPTPENRYHMAELVKFAVTNALNERTGYFDKIADNKVIGDNDEPLFDVEYDNSFAVIQAKNATTPRWIAGSKTVTLDTVEVSSRFRVNMFDLRSGKADIGKMTQRATARMEEAMAGYILNVLKGTYKAASGLGTPFYGTGSGIVTSTLDPMIRHFQRYGAVNLVGDIEIMDKLAQANGWVSDEMRNEYYQNGFLGKYKGCNAIQLVSGYKNDGMTPVFDTKLLFITPNGYESPLKIFRKGDVLAMEEQNADNATYELVLRQRFGAAVVFGNVPMLGVYQDASN